MTDELTPEPTQPAVFLASAPRGRGRREASRRRRRRGRAPRRAGHRAAVALGPATAGGMIRDARQAQGIDLASLAAMLKIPLRRLEALENGRHEELQGPTFERALAQAACRVLKIDPKPVLALLPQHERNTLERVTEGINTPFRDGQGSGGFELPPAMRPVVVVRRAAGPGRDRAVVRAASLGRAREATRSPAARPPARRRDAAACRRSAASAATPRSRRSSPCRRGRRRRRRRRRAGRDGGRSAAPLSPAAVSATAAQGIDEVLAHVAAAPNIPLQVIATADSWVEVVDAQGHTLLSRTVVAGESVGLDGALPMRVKIGNARGTHLKLRGDNVDLTPWTRDNVARLEVK